MGGLASTIVTGIATVLAALLTALPALTHRSRKIQRHQAAQIDALEESGLRGPPRGTPLQRIPTRRSGADIPA